MFTDLSSTIYVQALSSALTRIATGKSPNDDLYEALEVAPEFEAEDDVRRILNLRGEDQFVAILNELAMAFNHRLVKIEGE